VRLIEPACGPAIDAGHNDLYGRPAFAAAMREALARI
jgi:hypothetical protein